MIRMACHALPHNEIGTAMSVRFTVCLACGWVDVGPRHALLKVIRPPVHFLSMNLSTTLSAVGQYARPRALYARTRQTRARTGT